MKWMHGVFAVWPILWAPAAVALDQTETDRLVAELDDKQSNSGDYRAECYIEQKEKDKNDLVYEATVYRRDADDKWMILFSKPKAEAGKGYLRLDRNLFMYDPAVGKWERRTERERIGGTDSRRGDLDEPRLVAEYDARFVADEKLGKMDVHHLELKAKAGVDVAYPLVHLWVDKQARNILKRQEHSLSGKLMRTSYNPKWDKIFSKSKNGDVWVPREMRIYDEVEKGNSTVILLKEVNLDPLDANIFTKAWLEKQSR